MSDAVVVPAAEVRARRRPRLVVYVWAWELVCALLVAAPLHAWAERTFGARPDGDAVVFRPGGFELVMWALDDGPGLAIVLRTALVLLVFALFAGQVVSGALVAGLMLRREDGRPTSIAVALRAGVAVFLPLAGLTAVLLLLQALVLVGTLSLAAALFRGLTASLGDQRAFVWSFLVAGLGLAVIFVLGVAGDLVRVTIVEGSLGEGFRLRTALGRSLGVIRRTLGRGLVGWAWRAAIGASLVAIGAVLGDRFGAAGGGALSALFLLHQGLLFARAGLRTSWLAHALRLARAE